jgi:hypothetical protein
MKSGKCLSLLVALAFGAFAASSFACDKDKKSASKPCSGHKAAVTVADAEGQAETVKASGTPCAHAAKAAQAEKAPCSKSAQTVAEKAPCAHAAKTVAAEGNSPCGKGCSTPCSNCPHAQKAQTVAAEGNSPCGKGCSTPCSKCPHAQKAQTAAHGTGSGGNSGCCSKGKAKALLASLPAIQYRVGEETTSCSKQAQSMAKANGGSIQYVVGEEAFSTEDEAKAKLLNAIEEQIKTLQTVRYQVGDEYMQCPMSARKAAAAKKAAMAYSVAGFSFDDQAKAEKVAARVKEAVESVKLQYKVGDETFCCDKKANERSKETGKPVHFLVGDKELDCPTDAMRLFAEAKVAAIVEAAASETTPVEAGS